MEKRKKVTTKLLITPIVMGLVVLALDRAAASNQSDISANHPWAQSGGANSETRFADAPHRIREEPEGEGEPAGPKPPSAIEAESRGWHGDEKSVTYLTATGTEIRELPGSQLELVRGEAVIHPVRPVIVVTPMASTTIAHRACVLFHVNQGSERLAVLCDNGPDSISVLCHGKYRFSLGPGDEALITDHDPSYREIAQSDDIGRRKMKMHDLGHHLNVVTSEILLVHVLEFDPLLAGLAHSKDPHDRALRAHIIKTCAVLQRALPTHGYYSQGRGF